MSPELPLVLETHSRLSCVSRLSKRCYTTIARFVGAASFSGFTAGAIYTTYEPIYDNLKFAEPPHLENNSVSHRTTHPCTLLVETVSRASGVYELIQFHSVLGMYRFWVDPRRT